MKGGNGNFGQVSLNISFKISCSFLRIFKIHDVEWSWPSGFGEFTRKVIDFSSFLDAEGNNIRKIAMISCV